MRIHFMARILITSGPTRQYLDPVRYLTNASSGRMGAALAAAAIDLGHAVTIVSGAVEINYPPAAQVIDVVSTEEMLAASRDAFEHCDGLIGAAAPCDRRDNRQPPRRHACSAPDRKKMRQNIEMARDGAAQGQQTHRGARQGEPFGASPHSLQSLAAVERIN